MDKRKKTTSILCMLLTCVCLLVSISFPVSASDMAPEDASQHKVVRVGFPILANVTAIDEDGTYSGYTVDYLNELVKYTNWEIEYVQVEGDVNTQISTLGDMLSSGEIDMLGTMNISDYLQELYLYPTYSYGNTYTALTVAHNSSLWPSDDFQGWDGMKVATYPALSRRMEQLAQYAAISGFTYETIEYSSMDEVCDAVINGEADACLQVDISIPDGLRAIARFNPSPYYFALNKERYDLLRELNSAMYNLLESYPSLQSELYSRYFLHKGDFQLSSEDRKWIDSLKPLRVLYFTGDSPIQDCYDDEPSGVAFGFMTALKEATGLKTTPVFAKSYEEANQLIEENKVDLIAAVPGTSALSPDVHIRLSLPYFESSTVWVTNSNGNTEDESRPLPSANVEDELNHLKHHRKTGALLDAYCVSYYMRKNIVYDDLYVEWSNRNDILYSIGILPSVDHRLVGIINGFANSLSDQAKQTMLYACSRTPVHYTLSEQAEIYRYRILATAVFILVLALFISRMRHNRMLRENAEEVERLHQFSMMINECIIKYDVTRDQLIMQNNKFVFQDQEIMEPFLAENSNVEIRNENERRYVERLREMLRNKITTSELELFYEGMPRWFRIDLAYVTDEYTIGRLSDINKEVRQRTMLEHKASHDALTGMMNRNAVQLHIDGHLETCREGVFLLLDLDNFKKVNDTFGHHEGDKVLQKFSAFLDMSFRSEDFKARLGGDEFVVFMPVNTPEAVLREKLEQFLEDISKQAFKLYQSCGLSVSIGAAYASETANCFEALYREADSAMYVAKYGGKNGFFISDGSECSQEECSECEEKCRKWDYLVSHGVTNPEKRHMGADSQDIRV